MLPRAVTLVTTGRQPVEGGQPELGGAVGADFLGHQPGLLVQGAFVVDARPVLKVSGQPFKIAETLTAGYISPGLRDATLP